MRGKLREKPRRNGRSVLFIDYYPPVRNPQSQKFIRQENLKLYVVDKPTTAFEKGQNAVSREIAEKIYLKRMKALMLEEHKILTRISRRETFMLTHLLIEKHLKSNLLSKIV